MNASELEHADYFGRDQARRNFDAIQKSIADEAKSPGSTRHVRAAHWTLRTLPTGEVIALPTREPTTAGRLTIAEALRRTKARMP